MEGQIEYRDVEGYPGYRIGSDGTLWSAKTNRRLKGSIEHTPWNVKYRAYFLFRDGKQTTIRAHKLVSQAFLGPCPEGQEVRHLDGDGLNNQVDNLAYGTRVENIRDRDTHGTMVRGQAHRCAKVSDRQVDEIRSLFDLGVSPAEIAMKFGISKSHVKAIAKRIWRRLPAHA